MLEVLSGLAEDAESLPKTACTSLLMSLVSSSTFLVLKHVQTSHIRLNISNLIPITIAKYKEAIVGDSRSLNMHFASKPGYP